MLPTADSSAYEYLPEQSVTKAEFESIAQAIQHDIEEDVDMDELTQCDKCLVM